MALLLGMIGVAATAEKIDATTTGRPTGTAAARLCGKLPWRCDDDELILVKTPPWPIMRHGETFLALEPVNFGQGRSHVVSYQTLAFPSIPINAGVVPAARWTAFRQRADRSADRRGVCRRRSGIRRGRRGCLHPGRHALGVLVTSPVQTGTPIVSGGREPGRGPAGCVGRSLPRTTRGTIAGHGPKCRKR